MQPGAAMVAINENVPGELRRDLRLARAGGSGTSSPVSVAWGTPLTFDGLPRGGKGYKEASVEIEREDPASSGSGSRRCTSSAGRATRRRRHDETSRPTIEIAGTVAIVGFPNVGKSTLINRLTATRTAVVHETPGVTRDRKELLCEWSGTTFRLIDTGGVDRADTGPFGPQIAAQAREAVEEADLVLFVVDAKAGITPGDEELAEILRLSRRPVLVLANKLDDPRRDLEALEFHRLGLGDPIPISALHGHGSGDLLDEIVATAAGPRRAARRRGGDQGGDPRSPERRQVVAPERARRARAGHRVGGAGDDS